MAALGSVDCRLVAEVLLLVWRLERALQSPGPFYQHLTRLRTLPARPATRVPLPDSAVLSDLIALVCRARGLHPSCLRRSLVLKELRWRRAQPSRLMIGVSRVGGSLASHAWVEETMADSRHFQPLLAL